MHLFCCFFLKGRDYFSSQFLVTDVTGGKWGGRDLDREAPHAHSQEQAERNASLHFCEGFTYLSWSWAARADHRDKKGNQIRSFMLSCPDRVLSPVWDGKITMTLIQEHAGCLMGSLGLSVRLTGIRGLSRGQSWAVSWTVEGCLTGSSAQKFSVVSSWSCAWFFFFCTWC